MMNDILIAVCAIIVGFVLLVFSAEKFVEGAAATARHFGISALVIGMLIVGFGTSAPEIVVSIMAAMDGAPALALGNAIGSNIVNLGLVLGVTAVIAPIMVSSQIIRKELPILLFFSLLTGALLYDGHLSRSDGFALLIGFAGLIGWTFYSAKTTTEDPLEVEVAQELEATDMPLKNALVYLVLGFIVLIASSRLLVWGSVEIATLLAVDNLIIGLTVVAIGTSLPELATSILAARKGEHDIALGNVVGSNLFNLLAVIGIAGTISPMTDISPMVLQRDWLTMMLLTVAVLIMAIGIKRQGRINRIEGTMLLLVYCCYTLMLLNRL